MDFINRNEEMKRLDRLMQSRQGALAILWGRRRVGKTRLLLEWCRKHAGLYTVADQSAAEVQRRYFAEAVGSRLKGFADVEYRDWRAILNRLAADARALGWCGPLIVDELPYLVLSCPELPSILQRWMDHEAREAGLVVVLAGSSQRMMQGLVLDGSAPLYGRAHLLIELKPLRAGYILEALNLKHVSEGVEYYGVWGGIPRYWELAQGYGSYLLHAVDDLVLNPLGPLNTEPDRLLMEETPSSQSLRPVLDVIGMGAHRLTEIAARLGLPATSLSKPLARLQGLGLISREVPWGDSEKTGKRALYRIGDPFFRFWFKVVAPHRALLANASSRSRLKQWLPVKTALTAETWETLCRQAVPNLPAGAIAGVEAWEPASRFWRGDGPEWDIVAVSNDHKYLLLGEAQWGSGKEAASSWVHAAAEKLVRKGIPPLTDASRLTVVRAVFTPKMGPSGAYPKDVAGLDADTVLSALK